MASIKRFEDLIVWQESMLLCDAIYQISRNGVFSKDYGLRDQVRRAALSIPSNIAEGFERNSNKEFIYFLSIAKGSAGEVRSLLYVAQRQKYLELSRFEELLSLLLRVSSRLARLIRVLNESKLRGARYKSH